MKTAFRIAVAVTSISWLIVPPLVLVILNSKIPLSDFEKWFLGVWGVGVLGIGSSCWMKFQDYAERLPQKTEWESLGSAVESARENGLAIDDHEVILRELLLDVGIVKREVESLLQHGPLDEAAMRQLFEEVKQRVVQFKGLGFERRRSPRVRMIIDYFQEILRILSGESSNKKEILALLEELNAKDDRLEYTPPKSGAA